MSGFLDLFKKENNDLAVKNSIAKLLKNEPRGVRTV